MNSDDETLEFKPHRVEEKNPLPLHYVGDEFTIKGQVFVLTKVRNKYIVARPKKGFEPDVQESAVRPELLNPTTEG